MRFNPRLKKALACGAVLAILVSGTAPVLAYDNKDLGQGADYTAGGAHRLINQLALEQFVAKAADDPIWSHYDFAPDVKKLKIQGLTEVEDRYSETLKNLFQPRGLDVVRNGQTVAARASIEDLRSKSFADWIIDGGYSADEPEKFMSWRHFYNPVAPLKGMTYFTDIPLEGSIFQGIGDTAQSFESIMGEANPRIDSKSWVLDHPDNPNSWQAGKAHLQAALGDDREPDDFAAAWRSIGQTLHTIADMTVPAHVRNDSHPGNDVARSFGSMRADAYEYLVSDNPRMIRDNAGFPVANGQLANELAQAQNPGDLIQNIALYVNARYVSQDTIPYLNDDGEISDNNTDDFVFDLPDSQGFYQADSESGYRYTADELGDLNQYHDSWLTVNGWAKYPPMICYASVESQARRLIPIALAGTVRALELGIPRLTIDEVKFNQQALSGRIQQFLPQPDGTPLAVGLTQTTHLIAFVQTADGKSFNQLLPKTAIVDGRFSYEMSDLAFFSEPIKRYLENGESISIKIGYDLGGILVQSSQSAPLILSVIPELSTIEMGESVYFVTKVFNGPEQPGFRWDFGDGAATDVGFYPEASHAYQAPGNYTGHVYLVDPDSGETLAEDSFAVTVNPSEIAPDDGGIGETTAWETEWTEETEPPIEETEVTEPPVSSSYDFAAALAAWTADFTSRSNKSFDFPESYGTTTLVWVTPPFIQDGGVFGTYEVIVNETWRTGPKAGTSATYTQVYLYDAANPGQLMTLGDLQEAYPQFWR